MAEVAPISGFSDRVKLSEALPLETPFTLNIFPTNLCNFRCLYCAQSLGWELLHDRYGMDKQSMPLEMLKAIVEQCRGFRKKFKLVSFMGHGEPLLNKDIAQMVAEVKRADIAQRIEIITNGSLLTPKLSDALIAAGLTNIRISLQGLSAEAYQRICGAKIDYEAFLEQIKYYYEHKKEGGVFVKILDMSLEQGDKGGEEEFYRQFGGICDRMFVEKVKPVYSGVNVTEGITLTSDRYGNEHPPRKVCPLPFYMLSIWPSGEVAPCDAIYKPVVLGSVSKNTLPEMWMNAVVRDFRRRQLSLQRDGMEGCRQCCAPDDVSHPLDVLDDDAARLFKKNATDFTD